MKSGNLSKRIFLAIPLAEMFLAEISEMIQKVRLGEIRQGCKWVRPENVHVTLHFFGDTAPEEIPSIEAIAASMAPKFPAFEIALEGIDEFPNAKNPRVIWVGLHGDVPIVENLQRALEEKLSAAGFPCEARPFSAHATIARVAVGKGFSPALNITPGLCPKTPTKKVESFVLYESHLLPDGARYEVLKRFKFSG